MFANATLNKITNPGTGSPNRLLFTGVTVSPGPVNFNRYRSSNDHVSARSAPSTAYQFEATLGRVQTTQVAGTRPLYQCRVGGWDYMTSLSSTCEGQTVVGTIGYIYSAPPAAANIALRRCRVGAEHFDSVTTNCEGQIVEGILGYLLR